MKRWAIVWLVSCVAVGEFHGQTDENIADRSAVFSVLDYYRLACLDPGSKAVVLEFDSMAVAFIAEHPESALGLGMKSTAQLMLAESMWNPLDKLSQFQAWKPQLEDAIAQSPLDPDLRYFRLSVQFSVPALLEYNSDMDGDAAAVKEALSKEFWSEHPEYESFVEAFLNQL
jgi:hypothetical protein